MAERKKGLGRGIASLIGSDGPNVASFNEPAAALPAGANSDNAETKGQTRLVPVAYLSPGDSQPRRFFDQEKLSELAQSIKEKGILQPLIVQQKGATAFAIIAGERRWRAAQEAGLHEVPVLIEDYSDTDALEVALIENIQREELTAYEEAMAYQDLLTRFDYTQKQISEKVGKSRSHVANLLRLLTLPKSVIDHLQAGRLSMGHARALIGQENAEALATRIIDQGLSVRQTEALTAPKDAATPAPTGTAPSGSAAISGSSKDADTVELEKQIAAILGMTTRISHKGDQGNITLSYKSLEQLDDFLGRIGADL